MIVINALKTRAVGSATPDAAAAVQSEVDALLSRMPSLASNPTVSTATQAACAAVLGSAVVTLQ
jgi:hypothetical protein